MRIANLRTRAVVEAAVFAAFGVVAVIEARHLYTSKDSALLYARMQPGYYIAFLGTVLFALAIAHLIAEMLKEPVMRDAASGGNSERTRVLLIVLSLAAYAYLIGVIGYVCATIAFFIAILMILGVRLWPVGIPLSFVLTAANYFIFVKFCDVVWPTGSLVDFP